MPAACLPQIIVGLLVALLMLISIDPVEWSTCFLPVRDTPILPISMSCEIHHRGASVVLHAVVCLPDDRAQDAMFLHWCCEFWRTSPKW